MKCGTVPAALKPFAPSVSSQKHVPKRLCSIVVSPEEFRSAVTFTLCALLMPVVLCRIDHNVQIAILP